MIKLYLHTTFSLSLSAPTFAFVYILHLLSLVLLLTYLLVNSLQALSSIDDALKDLLLSSKVLSDYLMNVDAASAERIREDLGKSCIKYDPGPCL